MNMREKNPIMNVIWIMNITWPVSRSVWRSGGFMLLQKAGKYPKYGSVLTIMLITRVVSVNWYEMINYCCWLERMLKESSQTPSWLKNLFKKDYCISLPSEAEWEKAARGNNGPQYPYGNTFEAAKGNTRETGINEKSPIGCFAAGRSHWGCLDMSGNIWEWTRSLDLEYGKKGYDYRDGRENLENSGPRVLRGGSFYAHQNYARCAFRYKRYSHGRLNYLGFRLCLSPFNLLNL